MKQRVLITGGSGLLGLNWAINIRNMHDVVLGLHRRNVVIDGVEKYPVLLEDTESLIKCFKDNNLDMVIHTAGLTNVEKCEKEPELAYKTNLTLAKNVAEACAKNGITLVHISTDHLFLGEDEYVDENCLPNPVNVYGKSKADAELAVYEAYSSALIIRTNFYGWGTSYRQSFSDVIINSLRRNTQMKLFQDVYYTPIDIQTLVNAVMELTKLNASGIFNVVGDERISKYEFGLRIAEYFDLDKELIKAGKLSDHNDLVKRPLDMSLCNKKASKAFGKKMGDVSDQIRLLHKQELNGFKKEINGI